MNLKPGLKKKTNQTKFSKDYLDREIQLLNKGVWFFFFLAACAQPWGVFGPNSDSDMKISVFNLRFGLSMTSYLAATLILCTRHAMSDLPLFHYSQVISKHGFFSGSQVTHDSWIRMLVPHIRWTVFLQESDQTQSEGSGRFIKEASNKGTVNNRPTVATHFWNGCVIFKAKIYFSIFHGVLVMTIISLAPSSSVSDLSFVWRVAPSILEDVHNEKILALYTVFSGL